MLTSIGTQYNSKGVYSNSPSFGAGKIIGRNSEETKGNIEKGHQWAQNIADKSGNDTIKDLVKKAEPLFVFALAAVGTKMTAEGMMSFAGPITGPLAKFGGKIISNMEGKCLQLAQKQDLSFVDKAINKMISPIIKGKNKYVKAEELQDKATDPHTYTKYAAKLGSKIWNAGTWLAGGGAGLFALKEVQDKKKEKEQEKKEESERIAQAQREAQPETEQTDNNQNANNEANINQER